MILSLVTRSQPSEFSGGPKSVVPNKPGICGRSAPRHLRAFGIKRDAFAKDADSRRRKLVENCASAPCPLQECEPQKQCKLQLREVQRPCNKSLGTVKGRIRDYVWRRSGAAEEVVPAVTISAVVQVSADYGIAGATEHLRHRAVATCAFPDLTVKLFVLS
jgi:hypothetical protein